MFVVDTNILVYAIDSDCEEHEQCRSALEDWIKDSLPWYVTWSIIYEFLRVTTHPRVFRTPLSLDQAWRFINIVLSSASIRILSEGKNHAEIVYKTFQDVKGLRGNLVHDAHTAILMREHGIKRIYTRDMDFNRFHFLEVVDPMNT
jgi:uncharacterized protein